MTAVDEGRGSVTGRVLAVLAAFTPARPTPTLSEIARAAGLPLSTAHRLVGELTAWGALERGDDGRYRVGLRLWEVGALAPRSVGLRERAMPFLEDLYEATRQNVHLAVLDGAHAVYVERLAHPEGVRILSRVGGRLPLHATAVGLVLLAHAPSEVQDAVLEGPLPALTPRTVTDPRRLRRLLAQVRHDGAAVCDAMVDVATLSVAAPVRDADDAVVAALAVVVASPTASPTASSPTPGGRPPPRRVEPRTILPAVRATARGVSRALGATGPSRPHPSGTVPNG